MCKYVVQLYHVHHFIKHLRHYIYMRLLDEEVFFCNVNFWYVINHLDGFLVPTLWRICSSLFFFFRKNTYLYFILSNRSMNDIQRKSSISTVGILYYDDVSITILSFVSFFMSWKFIVICQEQKLKLYVYIYMCVHVNK